MEDVEEYIPYASSNRGVSASMDLVDRCMEEMDMHWVHSLVVLSQLLDATYPFIIVLHLRDHRRRDGVG